MSNNKGFTLAELMIVISVIGMIASVAVPSTFELRDSVKEQSVLANITMVRSYLEARSVSRTYDNLLERDMLYKELTDFDKNELSSKDSFINPFTKGAKIATGITASLVEDVSVVVYAFSGSYDGEFKGGIDVGNNNSKGKVYIQVFDNAYVLWGRDRNGESIFCQVIQ